jgi:hypothetical protein
MDFTAKVKVAAKTPSWDDNSNLTFYADYADGKNAQWAAATPSMTVTMVVNNTVAETVEIGDAFTLTFHKDS